MDKFSTDQIKHLIFASMLSVSTKIGENTDIFPDEPESEDMKQLFLYGYALFDIHNKAHDKPLDNSFFSFCIDEFQDMFKKYDVYGIDDSDLSAVYVSSSIKKFEDAHIEFLQNNTSDALIHYTSVVLSYLPSCAEQNLGAFSMAGVAFASLLPEILEYVGTTFTYILESWDNPADTSNGSTDSALSTSAKPQMKTWFILCLLALICSIIAIIHLWNQNSDLISRNKELQRSLNTAEATRDNYKALMGRSDDELAAISEEYDFYHSSAVIVTEQGSQYHTYGCYHWDYPIMIYNVENAQAQGYTPCLDCDPPQ